MIILKLISGYTPNPSFSANQEGNEIYQVNESHPENENEGKQTKQTNTCSKSTIEKKFWCLYGYV